MANFEQKKKFSSTHLLFINCAFKISFFIQPYLIIERSSNPTLRPKLIIINQS